MIYLAVALFILYLAALGVVLVGFLVERIRDWRAGYFEFDSRRKP